MVNVVILGVIAYNYYSKRNYMEFGVLNIIMLNVIMHFLVVMLNNVLVSSVALLS
jgi:hypothetical protein